MIDTGSRPSVVDDTGPQLIINSLESTSPKPWKIFLATLVAGAGLGQGSAVERIL